MDIISATGLFFLYFFLSCFSSVCHLSFFTATKNRTRKPARCIAWPTHQASSLSSFGLTNAQSCIGLRKFSARNTILSENCPAPPRCNQHSKYRAIDGSCNNLQSTLWGRSETAFQRILPAQYSDGKTPDSSRSLGTMEKGWWKIPCLMTILTFWLRNVIFAHFGLWKMFNFIKIALLLFFQDF